MADIISRLRLESGEFDSKIKRAAQELMAYSEHCRKTGLEMGYANRDAKEFAKALGNMQTTSSTARGKISELSDAFVNLRVMYKNMTDEEKNNQFGKNLSASLDKLKIRINEAKKDLADVTTELNGKKGGGLFGGGKLDGMLQVFGGNLMTKGTGMLEGLASEMYDMMQQGVELARQGEGIRIAFERLGRGDILDGLREATHGTVTDLELMKAAVKFNDFKLPLDELGTMLAFAQQKAKDTGQSVDYMVESITNGLGRQSKPILDNLGISAKEIEERMKSTGDFTKAVGEIVREQMTKAGDYVETAADRATQATVSLENKLEELGQTFAPIQEAGVGMFNRLKIAAIDALNGMRPFFDQFTEAGRIRQQAEGMGGSGKVNLQLNRLKVARAAGRDWYVQSSYNNTIKDYKKQISDLNFKIAAYGKGRDAIERGNIARLKEQKAAVEQQMKSYQEGAKQYLHPVKAVIDTSGAEQSITSLTKKLKDLQEQRKKAIAAGDTELSGKLLKQINQTKADIKGLGGTTTTRTTGSTKTPQTELQQNQTRINELTQQYVTLMAAASKAGQPLTDEQQKQTSEIQRQISELEKRNGLLKLYEEQAKGRMLGNESFRQKLQVEVNANNQQIEALQTQLKKLTDPKTVTVTAETDEAARKLEGLNAVRLSGKTFAVTLSDDAVTEKLNAIAGITIDPKTVTVTAETDEAARKLEGLNAVRLSGKTFAVTLSDNEVAEKLNAIAGITIDPKTVTVTAETDGASQKIEELKRQIAELQDRNLMINAGMASLDLQNVRDLSRTGGVTGFVGIGKSMMPIEGLPSMNDVVRERGGNLLDDKAMKAVDKEEKRNEKREHKEQKSVVEGIDQLNGGISNIFSGLEQIGIEIPDELKSIFGVVQGVTTILMGIATTIIAIEALVGADTFLPFANGGIVGKAAGGMLIPGNSFSGDNLRMPVVGGGMIGVNSGEVILNRAQAGNLASQLENGASQNLKLDAVISGEQIRLVLNNNGRRTGRGEYVQSTRRR